VDPCADVESGVQAVEEGRVDHGGVAGPIVGGPVVVQYSNS
jgi:hypothetical protein